MASMLGKWVAGVTLAFAWPGAAAADPPSWCNADALNLSERMICVDGILSQLDLDLNEAFDAARRVQPNLDQQSWLAERDECGMEVSCLEAAYRSRISELREIASGAGTGSGEVPRSRSDVAVDSEAVDSEPTPAPGEITVTELPSSSEMPWLTIPQIEVGEDVPIDRLLAPLDPAPGELAALDRLPALDGMIPRPWCEKSRLNPTERTICADRDLSRLDALLDLVYGRRTAPDDHRAQISWLRFERNACGTDPLCIARAYTARVDQLSDAAGHLD